MMRLDKYLAEHTGMTRSESRKAVTKGRVMIDGAVCRKVDTQRHAVHRHGGGRRAAGRRVPEIRLHHAQ